MVGKSRSMRETQDDDRLIGSGCCQQRRGTTLEGQQRFFHFEPLGLNRRVTGVGGHLDRRSHRERDCAERPRNLRPIPAAEAPVTSTPPDETAPPDCRSASPATPRLAAPSWPALAGRPPQSRRVGPPSISRFNCSSARCPPRDVDPREVPYPKRSMMRAIHSPSKFSLIITTMPRLRK